MNYSKKSIKQLKGKLIQLRYKTKYYENTIVGEITASTNLHILFNINRGGKEIFLNYSQIMEIKEEFKTDAQLKTEDYINQIKI